jgi:hypothetical protein
MFPRDVHAYFDSVRGGRLVDAAWCCSLLGWPVHSGLPCGAGQQYTTSPACGGLGGGGVVWRKRGGREGVIWHSHGVRGSYGSRNVVVWHSHGGLGGGEGAVWRKRGGRVGVIWHSHGVRGSDGGRYVVVWHSHGVWVDLFRCPEGGVGCLCGAVWGLVGAASRSSHDRGQV